MRSLPSALEQIWLLGERRPAYRILAYDARMDKISKVVCGTNVNPPLDLTPYCTDISWSPTQLQLTLADLDGRFHPDTGADKKFLVNGSILRLQEGDTRVDPAYWMTTFTGTIHGQIGWQKSRKTQTMNAKITVYSRDNTDAMKKRLITTKEYTIGTELGIFFHDVAQTFIGLEDEEIRIPPVLGMQFTHRTNQISQMAPWDAISATLQCVARMPFFDGEGRLACINKNMNRLPDRTLPTYSRVVDYQIPERNQDYTNKIKVIFLDCNLERVDGQYQKLGEASITTGFFTNEEKLTCWWSDDHKQRAVTTPTDLRKIKGVNDNLVGKYVHSIGSESYAPRSDDLGGVITIGIDIWMPLAATAMLAELLALAAWPDKTESESTNKLPTVITCPGAGTVLTSLVGGGPVTGVIVIPPLSVASTEDVGLTIPWGRILQAQATGVLMLLMMSLGSCQYEIWGTPYDYAYLEKESTAIEDGIEYYQENLKEIKIDFIGTYEQADYLALTELIWEKSNSYPRRLIIEDDLALEPGDILVLPDGRKFLITNLSKQMKRGEVPLLNLDCFKVMTA